MASRSTTPERGSIGFRIFCGLIGLSVLCIAVGGVVAIASGGYRPEDYAGRFDPVRACFVVAMASMAIGFALPVGAALLAWIREGAQPSLIPLAFFAGLAIGAAAIVPLVATASSSGTMVVPTWSRLGVVIGLGLMIVAMASAAIGNIMGSVRRRDWFHVTLALVAVAVLGLFLWLRFS